MTSNGRTWRFSHAIGRVTGEAGGFVMPVAVASAPGDVLFVLSRGMETPKSYTQDPKRRLGKFTIDQEFIGDYGRREFTWPTGVAVSPSDGKVYCTDEYQNEILIFDSDGPFLQHPQFNPDGEKLASWGEKGSGEGQLDGPTGLAFGNGHLHVVDGRNDRVQTFTPDGGFVGSWGSQGNGDGDFDRPWGVATDSEGNVYVADWGNGRVQKFTSDGIFDASFGSYGKGTAELDHPAGVAVDSEGDVFVTDWGNNRVQIYAANGDHVTSLYGDATVLSNHGRWKVENEPEMVAAHKRVTDYTPMGRFRRPVGIAVDDQDRVIVTDAHCGRLQVYLKNGHS